MPDERHLAFLNEEKFGLLDLLRLKTKSFEVDCGVIPKSPERESLNLNHVHWVSVNSAFVVMEEGLTDGTKNHYVAQLEIDHENSLCAVRKFHQFDYRGEVEFMEFVPTTGGRFGVVLSCAPDSQHTYYEISDLHTSEWKFKKIRKLPAKFDAKGELDGYVYSFLMTENGDRLSKLNKLCLETGKKTTVKLQGTPVRLTRCQVWTDSTVWIGHRLIVALNDYNDKPGVDSYRLFVLDVDSLEWRQLEWNCRDQISALSSDGDNTLVVMSKSADSCGSHNFHRFALNRPDKLSTICWIATRNHANRVPAFESHVLNGQPKNSPFRRVFGVLPPTKRPSSESPQPSCSGLRTVKRPRVAENEE